MGGRDDTTFEQKVLVLTPVKDAARHLERYIELLEGLSYPRSLMSLGLMESDSKDDTFETLLRLEQRLSARCRRVKLAKRDFGFRMPAGIPRWAPAYQLLRRSVLARSRNHLLFRALRDEDWVRGSTSM
jgi:Anp1